MRLLPLLPLLFVLLPAATLCQENFQPGYFTMLSGDTVHGMIDYRDWEKNPVVIHFREKADDQVVFYTPEMIRDFGVDNSRYESSTVLFEQSRDKTGDYPVLTEYREVTKSVFFEVLVGGSKKLFRLTDEDGHDQFFIGSADKPVWLMMNPSSPHSGCF